jgi:hypothetical protein
MTGLGSDIITQKTIGYRLRIGQGFCFQIRGGWNLEYNE